MPPHRISGDKENRARGDDEAGESLRLREINDRQPTGGLSITSLCRARLLLNQIPTFKNRRRLASTKTWRTKAECMVKCMSIPQFLGKHGGAHGGEKELSC